jgi:hypothetical protein
VQGVAIGLHVLSGLAITADNKNRVATHPPTTVATVAKATVTTAAIASSAAAYVVGNRLGKASGEDGHPRDPEAAERARGTMRWLQWATPALTGLMLVLDAELGEQQRGPAGLLDRPW